MGEAPEAELGFAEDSVPPSTGSREAAACASLRDAFRAAGQRERALREELRAAEKRITTLEEGRPSEANPLDSRASDLVTSAVDMALDTRANAVDRAQMEDALAEEMRVAEARTWFLAQVANEMALSADLQQLSALESEVEWQRCNRIAQEREELAEQRCARMAAVVNGIAGALAVDPGGLRA